MNTLIRIFDYILLFIYDISFNLGDSGGFYHVISHSDNYKDAGIINYSNKFDLIMKKYDSLDVHGVFVRYMLRSECPNYEKWRRYQLIPKDPYNTHYLSFKIGDFRYMERRRPSDFITPIEWLNYCIPQIIHSHLRDLIQEHAISTWDKNPLGISMFDYEFLVVP